MELRSTAFMGQLENATAAMVYTLTRVAIAKEEKKLHPAAEIVFVHDLGCSS